MPSSTEQLDTGPFPLPYETPSNFKLLPLSLPRLPPQPSTFDLKPIFRNIISYFPSLEPTHFTTSVSAVWRDTFALSGTLRTFYGPNSILSAWTNLSSSRNATDFRLLPESIKVNEFGPDGTGWIDAAFTFSCTSSPAIDCSGFVSVILEDGRWKIWLFRTVLDGLRDSPSVDFLEPHSDEYARENEVGTNDKSSTNGIISDNKDAISTNVLIVGAGQAGLAVASRLKALKVSYILIDRNARIGDNWGKRYDSAKLHTIREYSHLPMDRTFNESDYDGREWMTKDDLASGYARWAKKFGINNNFWGNTEIISGSWDLSNNSWSAVLKYEDSSLTLTCRHIVLCGGPGGQIPTIPELPQKSLFKGHAVHSATWSNASAFSGQRGIVVGAANTACDIAEDMVASQLSSVTMLQRRRTYVLPTEYFSRVARRTWNPTFPTELADKLSYSMPIGVSRLLALKGLHAMAASEPERFDALEKAGYSVQRNGDIYWHICERLGGHYMDMGCCQKIVDGKIKVIGSSPVAYTENGLKLADGSEVEADVVVFATGFVRTRKDEVAKLLGEDVAEKMGEFWGIDEEGELNGAFKRTKQPGLWYHGGTLGHARYFSRHIALQIKAELDGTPLPLFDEKV